MRQFDDLSMRELVFLLTEQCNLDCVYCYETKKNRRAGVLPARFVKDRIVEAMRDGAIEELGVSFFGGEPLLAFDTIRDVVDWFLAVSWPERPRCHFLISTNATLLDDARKTWFAARRDHVTLSLSMDGTKAAHDRNRSGSYDRVVRHVEFFRQNWPLQPVKMTVGPRSLDAVFDGVVEITRMGMPVEPDVVFEDAWGDEAERRHAVAVWAGELERLVEFYHQHPELRRPPVLRRRLLDLFGPDRRGQRTFCGAGRHTTTYMPDGVEYPCFRFAPLTVDAPLRDVFAAPDRENPMCARCPFEKICPTCEGLNYLERGSCFERTTHHCEFFKASLLATARLWLMDHGEEATQGVGRELSADDRDRLRMLLAVKLVNDHCGPLVEGVERVGPEAYGS